MLHKVEYMNGKYCVMRNGKVIHSNIEFDHLAQAICRSENGTIYMRVAIIAAIALFFSVPVALMLMS